MPRIVRHSAMGPIKIEPQTKPIWVCACGLSKTFPFCDATHKNCTGEKPDRVYRYADDGKTVLEESSDAPVTTS